MSATLDPIECNVLTGIDIGRYVPDDLMDIAARDEQRMHAISLRDIM